MKRTILISAIILTLGLTAFGQGEKATALAPTPAQRQQAATPVTKPSYGGGVAGGQSLSGVGGNTITSGFNQADSNFGHKLSLFGGGGSIGSSSSVGVPPVVVRFSVGEDEANAALEEDLNIMTRLIERSLQHGIGEDESDERMGIKLLYSEGGRSVRGLYLDGFGALFMIKVGFPVFAPSAPEPKEPQPASDSEWDKAKRDLYGEAEGRSAEIALLGGGSQFDADQVEELKKVLLQTLKNAANIHNLKPNDSIAITVFGRPSSVVQVRKSRSRKESSNPLQTAPAAPRLDLSAGRRNSPDLAQAEQKFKAGMLAQDSVVLRSSNQGTVLTLRVKKSDVDAFATDKLDFEAFQKKAEQNSYSGNGYGITSINSWSRSGSSSGTIAR